MKMSRILLEKLYSMFVRLSNVLDILIIKAEAGKFLRFNDEKEV
jgi:hypothetical protein